MIKTIFALLSCLFVRACQVYNLSEVVYIASVGVEPSENGYTALFYLPVSDDVGRSDSSPDSNGGEYAKIEGTNLSEIFSTLNQSLELEVNLRHISSFILNKELLNPEFLEEFIGYIKNVVTVDFNFYIFSTEEKIEDLYSFKNPNKESTLNSVIILPFESETVYLYSEPMHFLEFCRKYYGQRSILLPLLQVEKYWTIEEKEVTNFICKDSILFYKEETKVVKEEKGSNYLKENLLFYDTIEEEQIEIKDYKIKTSYKDKLSVKVRGSYRCLSTTMNLTKEKVADYIVSKIKDYLTVFEDFDPLDVTYYNNALGKNVSYDEIEYDIQLKPA